MQKIITLLILAGFTGLLLSCGSKNQQKPEVSLEQSELPPSLKPSDTGIKLLQLSEKEQKEL